MSSAPPAGSGIGARNDTVVVASPPKPVPSGSRVSKTMLASSAPPAGNANPSSASSAVNRRSKPAAPSSPSREAAPSRAGTSPPADGASSSRMSKSAAAKGGMPLIVSDPSPPARRSKNPNAGSSSDA